MELAYELQKLGLSDKEARVYLANLEQGASSVQNIAKKSGVNRATTYVVLNSLIQKGLCSTFIQNKKTQYAASDPEQLMSLFEVQKKQIEEQEKHFQSLMAQFKLINNQETGKPVVKFYEGKQGLLNCYDEFVLSYIQSFNPDKRTGGSAYAVYNRDLVNDFFTENEKKQFRDFRVKHNLPIKAIYTMEKGVMPNTPDGMRIKVSSDEFDMSADIGIHEKCVRFLIFGEKPSGILIEDEGVAKTLTSLFKLAWEAVQARDQKQKKEK
jgi:HTH-type transcriptional regulator, sugar sensing transcriptional regulator